MTEVFLDEREVNRMIKEAREEVLEIIDDFDLELFLTDLKDIKTEKIVEIPKEIQMLMDEYWKFIKENLKERIKQLGERK